MPGSGTAVTGIGLHHAISDLSFSGFAPFFPPPFILLQLLCYKYFFAVLKDAPIRSS